MQSTGTIPEDLTKCPHCGELVKTISFTRHVGQCKNNDLLEKTSKRIPPTPRDGNRSWMYEAVDDEGDPGHFGVDDQEHSQYHVDSTMAEVTEMLSSLPLEDPRDIAPPELHLTNTGEGSTPLGKVVKVSKFKANWMSLGKVDDDEEDDTDETDDETIEDELNQETRNSSAVPMGQADSQAKNGSTDTGPPLVSNDDDSIGAVVGASEVLEMAYSLDLEDRYRNIADREDYSVESDWSVARSCLHEDKDILNPFLRDIMEGEDGETLGLCVRIDSDRRKPPHLEKGILSMVRIIQYCNLRSNSRGFVDNFLDLVAEEMEVRGFDPRNRPTRDFVCRKVMAMYGGGCAPEVRHVTVADETMVVSAQEEEEEEGAQEEEEEEAQEEDSVGEEAEVVDIPAEHLNRTNTYRTKPREIDNRERNIVDVVCFNTRNMILDLLSDGSIFDDIHNLVLNSKNPFLPYKNTDGVYDELLDGSWYRDTVQRLQTFPQDPFREDVEFLLPLILYVDKTGTSINQRYPLEPFIFTSAIIKRRLRNQPTSWRPLGFIPDLETKSSAEKDFVNKKNRGATAQSYHLALEHLLQGLEEVQNKGIVHWFRLGKHAKKVRIRPEVACIINDGKSADMITLRCPSSHPSRRISRSCETKMYECDQTRKECDYVAINNEIEELFRVVGMSSAQVQNDPKYVGEDGKMMDASTAKGIVEEAKKRLNQLHFHPVRLAFYARCIRFGLDPRNIWGANPIDLMHAFQSGILMYLVKMVLDKLSVEKRVRLDRLVHKLFHCLRTNEREDYPRLNFSKGFSKLTNLTSDEWAGKLFVLLVVLHTQEGKKIFQEAKTFDSSDVKLPKDFSTDFKRDITYLQKEADALDLQLRPNAKVEEVYKIIPKDVEEQKAQEKEAAEIKKRIAELMNDDDGKEEMSRKCSANDFTHLAESLLCFHAWYKLGVTAVDSEGNINATVIRDSVARMLAMVRWYCPRKKGNGWKIQKFHDILHLALDIQRFGPAWNFDAGPMESGLKYWAKLPARTAQMRGYNTFAKQVAWRTFEYQCFAKAIRLNGLSDPCRAKSKARGKNAKPEDSRKNAEEPGLPVLKGTTYRVYADPLKGARNSQDGQQKGVSIYRPSGRVRQRKNQGSFVVSRVVENFLRFQPKGDANDRLPLIKENGFRYWELKTELSLRLPREDTITTLRCHPNYRSDGPWYDWVIVHFDCPRKPKHHYKTQYTHEYVPCKILAFAYKPKSTDTSLEKESQEIWVLVHGCDFRLEGYQCRDDSVLLEHWELAYHDLSKFLPREGRGRNFDGSRSDDTKYIAPQLSWIRPESIMCRCLVIEEEPGIPETITGLPGKEKKNKVLLVRKRARWPIEFTWTD